MKRIEVLLVAALLLMGCSAMDSKAGVSGEDETINTVVARLIANAKKPPGTFYLEA